jgi:hypothetical protein
MKTFLAPSSNTKVAALVETPASGAKSIAPTTKSTISPIATTDSSALPSYHTLPSFRLGYKYHNYGGTAGGES